jgi:hypothetical protein
MREHTAPQIQPVYQRLRAWRAGQLLLDTCRAHLYFPDDRLLGSVLLVQAHQQVDQLAADGRGLQQGGQLGQVDEPPRIPARPVVVGSVTMRKTR